MRQMQKDDKPTQQTLKKKEGEEVPPKMRNCLEKKKKGRKRGDTMAGTRGTTHKVKRERGREMMLVCSPQKEKDGKKTQFGGELQWILNVSEIMVYPTRHAPPSRRYISHIFQT